MRTLIAAPYVGEIGWELLSWQGRVRYVFKRGRYNRLIVLGAAGKSAFYADMTGDYRVIDLSTLPGDAYEDRRVLRAESRPMPADAIIAALEPTVRAVVAECHAAGEHVDELWPAYNGTIYPCDPGHQRFIRFRPSAVRVATPDTSPLRMKGAAHEVSDLHYATSVSPMNGAAHEVSGLRRGAGVSPVRNHVPTVLLVQRRRAFGAANWSDAQWHELDRLLRDAGVNTRIYPHDAASAIAAAAQADLAVGQSTGGLHLASLCGCPHVVWAEPDQTRWTAWSISNRQRYETFWNPLGTPVEFHGVTVWPTPAEAAEWTLGALHRIGRRTGSIAARCRFDLAWRWHDWLVRQVIRRPGFARWPWRVQQFVRYQMV